MERRNRQESFTPLQFTSSSSQRTPHSCYQCHMRQFMPKLKQGSQSEPLLGDRYRLYGMEQSGCSHGVEQLLILCHHRKMRAINLLIRLPSSRSSEFSRSVHPPTRQTETTRSQCLVRRQSRHYAARCFAFGIALQSLLTAVCSHIKACPAPRP